MPLAVEGQGASVVAPQLFPSPLRSQNAESDGRELFNLLEIISKIGEIYLLEKR